MPEATQSDRPTAKPRKRRWKWARRLIGTFGVLLMLLAIGHGVWGWRAASQLEGQLATYRERGEPTIAGDLIPPSVPEEENPAVVLTKAAESLDLKGDEWRTFQTLSDAPRPWSDAQVARLLEILRRHEESLRLARAARSLPLFKCNWKIPFRSPLVLVDFPFLSDQRGLANLIAQAALHAHDQGDDVEALRLIEDIRFIGNAVDRQIGMCVIHLVASGIGRLADATLMEISPTLAVSGTSASKPTAAAPVDRADVKQWIAKLLDERELREGHRRSLLGERLTLIDKCQCVADGRGVPTDLVSAENPLAPLVCHLVRPQALNDAALIGNYFEESLNALSADDYVSFLKSLPSVTFRARVQPFLLHYFAAMYGSDTASLTRVHFGVIADRRMTAIILAARLYRLDYGDRLPQTLQDLVPDYLPAVPNDPFTAKQPFHYLPTGEYPRVYSVGEDMQDDGGIDKEFSERRPKTYDQVQYLLRKHRSIVSE